MNDSEKSNQAVWLFRKRIERGQSFTELAISLLFLLILLATVIDLGWAFYTLIALRDAAQEAASYGAICPLTNDATPVANTYLIQRRLQLSASEPLDINDIDINDITIEFTNKLGAAAVKPVMGGSIIVTVTVHHQIMTPFAGSFIGTQNYPLTVTVADTVMRSKWLKHCDYN